jgi:hypothetical protein
MPCCATVLFAVGLYVPLLFADSVQVQVAVAGEVFFTVQYYIDTVPSQATGVLYTVFCICAV